MDVGHCVLYRFRVAATAEAEFIDAWSQITVALRRDRGALGSRLHRGPDGLWYAYAQWPSAEVRAAAFAGPPVDEAARARLRAAVTEFLPELVLDPVADYLVLPAPTAPPTPWQVVIADGSGNVTTLAGDHAAVTVTYAPITAATSSSGTYDGGPPRAGTVALDHPSWRELWRQLAALPRVDAPAPRALGTGAVTVTSPAGEVHHHVPAGAPLRELVALLAPLGAP